MEQLHATTVAIESHGVMITGASGAGKSDLALQLIDRGAQLVSDDYTALKTDNGLLIARPPLTIAGKIEVRGLGLLTLDYRSSVAVSLIVDLDAAVERFPDPLPQTEILGLAIPTLPMRAFEASAVIKVEWALKMLAGLG